MGMLSKLFNKAEEQPAERRSFTEDELDQVARRLKELYGKPSYHVGIEDRTPGLSESKFGGYPYWPAHMPYPKTSQGEQLVLLAQINFAEIKPKSQLLPSEGLLQLFIETDDLYGMDLKDTTVQESFRAVFHPKIDPSITEESVRAQKIPSTTTPDQDLDLLPLCNELAITFGKTTDTLNFSLDEFSNAAEEAFETELGVKVTESLWKFLDNAEYSYLSQEIGGEGHKMLGYPYFVQSDPRNAAEKEAFDTVLLQIDSDMKHDIQWGDCGIGVFLINSQDLRNGDFSRVMYTWDCG